LPDIGRIAGCLLNNGNEKRVPELKNFSKQTLKPMENETKKF